MLPAHLFFLKTIYGKFSFKFQSSFEKSSNSIRISKNFLQPCSKINALSHFRAVVDPQKKTIAFSTNMQISFGDIPFGITFNALRKQKRQFQCYDIGKYETVYWKRLGYKERIFNHGVKRVFHFLDDEFFFGELFFSDLRKVDDKMISAVLLEKYTGEKQEKVNGNFRINGKDGYVFFENTGINLSIKYINCSSEEIKRKIELITNKSADAPGYAESEMEDML